MKNLKKLGKRGLALFVALVLLVGMVPMSAFAALSTGHSFQVKVAKVYLKTSGNVETEYTNVTCYV